jgi:hypothetical protein
MHASGSCCSAFDSATPESTVRGWITEHGIDSITAITGKRPDIAACLNALDLGVVASLWSEPSPGRPLKSWPPACR